MLATGGWHCGGLSVLRHHSTSPYLALGSAIRKRAAALLTTTNSYRLPQRVRGAPAPHPRVSKTGTERLWARGDGLEANQAQHPALRNNCPDWHRGACKPQTFNPCSLHAVHHV